MNDDLKNADFSKLPNWVKFKMKECGVINPEEWIHISIPALNNQSVLKTLKLENGEELLRNFFAILSGKF